MPDISSYSGAHSVQELWAGPRFLRGPGPGAPGAVTARLPATGPRRAWCPGRSSLGEAGQPAFWGPLCYKQSRLLSEPEPLFPEIQSQAWQGRLAWMWQQPVGLILGPNLSSILSSSGSIRIR